MSDVIAPPYDVISSDERERLYAKSPFNVVRLTLGKEPDFYDSAVRHWRDWTKEGILTQDKAPAFYLYEQIFKHPLNFRLLNRIAIVGILNLEGNDSVFRHEATFEGPRRDRLSLLEKTHTNLCPIFGLYSDPQRILAKLFSDYRSKPLLFEAKDNAGTIHRGWAIEKKSDQEVVQNFLSCRNILIADGHHRFETALEYRSQMRRKNPKIPPGASFDFVMMALVAFEEEGLIMLPTHRAFRSLEPFLSREAFLEKLEPYFDLLPLVPENLFVELEKRPRKEKVFGCIFKGGKGFLLRLKDLQKIRNFLPEGKPEIWYEIEANILNHFIFDCLWKISSKELPSLVEYTHSFEEAAEAVQKGDSQVAFLLRSEDLGTIYKLAEAGERMPQKTTYFYPKLASGLFFYYHEKP